MVIEKKIKKNKKKNIVSVFDALILQNKNNYVVSDPFGIDKLNYASTLILISWVSLLLVEEFCYENLKKIFNVLFIND